MNGDWTLHKLPFGVDREKLKNELVWICQKIVVLKKFSGFPFCSAMQIKHGPITLDQSLTTSSIYSIPGVSVSKIHRKIRKNVGIIKINFDLNKKSFGKLTLYQQRLVVTDHTLRNSKFMILQLY